MNNQFIMWVLLICDVDENHQRCTASYMFTPDDHCSKPVPYEEINRLKDYIQVYIILCECLLVRGLMRAVVSRLPTTGYVLKLGDCFASVQKYCGLIATVLV